MNPGCEVLAKGWVRTKRGNKQVKFIALNDGSTIKNIQIVADAEKFDPELIKKITTGASIGVTGTLVESKGTEQHVEIQANEITLYGECDPMRYPLQKKDTSFEYLRTVAHLRLRTNTFGAILRIRHAMAFAIHKFFQRQGLRLPQHSAHHRIGCRGCRRYVPGHDPGPCTKVPMTRRESRLQQGLLRQEDQPYRKRTARR